jgi:hypothetical protein
LAACSLTSDNRIACASDSGILLALVGCQSLITAPTALQVLYFAGYYRWGREHYDPSGVGLSADPQGPWFSPREFNSLREVVERESGGWRYSGNADLVLINAFLSRGAEPIIDWQSTLGGPIVDANDRYLQRSIGEIIELVSREIDTNYESADWGVGEALWPAAGPDQELGRLQSFARDLLANVIANIVAGPISGPLHA